MTIEQDWATYANQSVLNATDTILARTAAGAGVEVPGSALVRFDSSGNVGIGTNSPQQTASGRTVLAVNGSLSSLINIGSGGSYGSYWFWNGSSATLASINMLSLIAGASPITFANSLGESARIDSAGRLLVGTTTPAAANVRSLFKATASDQHGLMLDCLDRGLFIRNSGASSGYYAYFEYNGGVNNGSITWSGSSTSYNTSSDYRLKDDLKPLTGSLDRILSLPVYDFRWKSTGNRARGFMAHEYGAVVPGGATGEKDAVRDEQYEIEPERVSDILGPDGVALVIPALMGTRMVPDYQGIDQSKVTPDLVGAVQEMAAIIDGLRARIATLEAAL